MQVVDGKAKTSNGLKSQVPSVIDSNTKCKSWPSLPDIQLVANVRL